MTAADLFFLDVVYMPELNRLSKRISNLSVNVVEELLYKTEKESQLVSFEYGHSSQVV